MTSFKTAATALLLSATASIPSLSVQAQVAQPKDGIATAGSPDAPRLPYQRFTLPNGLTTLVHTDRSSPSIFVGIWYRTGSRDEPPGKTGFAHLFEHLMFQSTAHRPQEFMAVLKQIGAINANGMTRTDDTVYFETVPSNALDTILWLESDRMGFLDGGITQGLLDEQRRVVLNEKRQGELRPEEQAWRQFLRAFYPADHPYAHPTIGSTADIEGATLDDVRQWFRTHYGAGNAVLVLSGDIDPATARDKVTRYFGAIRPGTPISRPIQWTPSLTETRRDLLYGNFPAVRLSRSWPIPTGDPRERTLLLLATRAMAGPKEAPLVKALVTDAKVATQVSTGLTESALGSVLNVAIDVRPGVAVDAAERALDAALRDYASRGPQPERLHSIVAASDTALLRTLENADATGNLIGEGEVAHGDPAFVLRQHGWVAKAGADELRTIAARWLDRPYYQLVTQPAPGLAAAPTDVDRTRMPEPGPFKTAIAFPPITRMTLANGMIVVVARRSGAGMIDMSLQFPVGTLTTAPGVASPAFALLPSGGGAKGAPTFAQRLSRLGVQLASGADPWNSGVFWSATGATLDETMALVADMVRRPVYPGAAIADANAAAARAVEASARAPSAAGIAILKRAIWGDADPRGHIATPQDGPVVTRQALSDFAARHIVPNDATLYVVGDVDPQRVRALAERRFAGWTAAAATPPPALPVMPPPHGPRLILVDAPGAEQTSITVGAALPPFDKDMAAAETLVAAVVADIGAGRLNRNLRQDKGWTYGFGGGIDDAPRGERLFVASGAVQADRTGASLAELRREFADVVAARPLTATEIDAQRTAMTRAAAQQFSRNAAFLNAMVTSGTYHVPLDRAASSDRRLAAVTLDQAQAVARKLFRPDGLTWVVIGDRKTIEPQLRALDPGPIEIRDVYGRPAR